MDNPESHFTLITTKSDWIKQVSLKAGWLTDYVLVYNPNVGRRSMPKGGTKAAKLVGSELVVHLADTASSGISLGLHSHNTPCIPAAGTARYVAMWRCYSALSIPDSGGNDRIG